MSFAFPWLLLTLAIRPTKMTRQYGTGIIGPQDEPGRSQKDRSAISGPLIWSVTQLVEKLSSGSATSSSAPSKKSLRGFVGFRMARCARLMRPSTSALSVIVGPKNSFRASPRVWPFSFVMNRNETIHCQGPLLCERRHSVGHLGKTCDESVSRRRLKVTQLPSASPSGSRQRNSGNGFNQRRFSGALRANHSDLRKINLGLYSEKVQYALSTPRVRNADLPRTV